MSRASAESADVAWKVRRTAAYFPREDKNFLAVAGALLIIVFIILLILELSFHKQNDVVVCQKVRLVVDEVTKKTFQGMA